MKEISNTADVDMASIEQLDELASNIETLEEAAYERMSNLNDEIAEHPEVNRRIIDNLPDCFTHRYYCEIAIQILEGISHPVEGRAITQDEADDIESALSDSRSWLDQAGVPTEQLLYPPMQQRTPQPGQYEWTEDCV